MNNKEKFKRTYDDIHAPEALLWKVKDMSKEKNTKRFKVRNVARYAVCTLALVAVTYAASDGISYATTGETLTAKIKVMISGEEKEQEVRIDENGKGEMVLEKKDGATKTIKITPKSREELEKNEFAEITGYEDENGNPVDPELLARLEADGSLSYYGNLENYEIVVELDENGEVISTDIVEK